MGYSAKAPIIINYTILADNTWENAAEQVKGVRRWLIKPRDDTYAAFDLAFMDSPSTHITTIGSGFSFDNCDLPPVWVRGTLGTVIEILYWS